MTQLANVDSRNGEFLVCSYSKTPAGFWIANGTFIRLPGGCSDDQLGTAATNALAASTEQTTMPPRSGPSPFEPVLRELKLKSYGQYMKGTLSVGLMREGPRVVITPKRNGGAREGFTELTEESDSIDGASANHEVGSAIRRALENAC